MPYALDYAFRVQYNNEFKVLITLPRYFSSLGMCTESHVDCFYTTMRKRSVARTSSSSSSSTYPSKANLATAWMWLSNPYLVLKVLLHLAERNKLWQLWVDALIFWATRVPQQGKGLPTVPPLLHRPLQFLIPAVKWQVLLARCRWKKKKLTNTTTLSAGHSSSVAVGLIVRPADRAVLRSDGAGSYALLHGRRQSCSPEIENNSINI